MARNDDQTSKLIPAVRKSFLKTLIPSANPDYLQRHDERGDRVYYDLEGNEYEGDIDDPTDPDMKLQYGDSSRVWKRGALSPLPLNQEQIRFRVDRDILEWFSNQVREDQTRGDGNYLHLMNAALREHIERIEVEKQDRGS